MRRALGPGALLASLVLLLAACGGSSRAAPDGPDDGNPFHKTALWVEVDGEARPFENGASVVLGEVNVELFVAPFPPAREGSIDLYVTDRASGSPVEDGAMNISFDMSMPHGSISAQALPTGGGHSLVPYKLVMPGEWRMDITISRSADVAQLSLLFEVS